MRHIFHPTQINIHAERTWDVQCCQLSGDSRFSQGIAMLLKVSGQCREVICHTRDWRAPHGCWGSAFCFLVFWGVHKKHRCDEKALGKLLFMGFEVPFPQHYHSLPALKLNGIQWHSQIKADIIKHQSLFRGTCRDPIQAWCSFKHGLWTFFDGSIVTCPS